VLKRFGENYDTRIRNKAGLKKMKMIEGLLQSEDHCRITDFTFELRLCGKNGCDLCLSIGRNVRTPEVNINGKNLREEILDWMVLPVLDPDDSNHYLSTEVARKLIKSKPITFTELKEMIPNSKLDSAEKKSMKTAKAIDKAAGKNFHYSKVRDVVSCDYCGAISCIFSNKAVGKPGGPSQTSLDRLRVSLEKGHVCGRDLTKKFERKGFLHKDRYLLWGAN